MILCGTLIAQAAVNHDHKFATLSSEYGTETRGTFAKSDVIVNDEAIDFPDVTDADFVVCLHQVAYERYSGKLPAKALLLYDTEMVKPHPENSARERGLAIEKMARELGNPATANIITMGIITGYLQVITQEGAEAAIAGFFKKKGDKVIALNLKAFAKGYELGEQLK